MANYAETALESVVRQRVINLMASSSAFVSIQGAVDSIEALKLEKCVQFSSRGLQGKITAVTDILNGMLRGISPTLEHSSATDFFKTVIGRLEWFFIYQAPAAADGSRAPPVYGRDGLDKAWAATEARMQKENDSISLVDLEDFQTFKFMLTSERKASLSGWVLAAVEATTHGGGDIKSSKRAVSSASSAAASASAACKSQAPAVPSSGVDATWCGRDARASPAPPASTPDEGTNTGVGIPLRLDEERPRRAPRRRCLRALWVGRATTMSSHRAGTRDYRATASGRGDSVGQNVRTACMCPYVWIYI